MALILEKHAFKGVTALTEKFTILFKCTYLFSTSSRTHAVLDESSDNLYTTFEHISSVRVCALLGCGESLRYKVLLSMLDHCSSRGPFLLSPWYVPTCVRRRCKKFQGTFEGLRVQCCLHFCLISMSVTSPFRRRVVLHINTRMTLSCYRGMSITVTRCSSYRKIVRALCIVSKQMLLKWT